MSDELHRQLQAVIDELARAWTERDFDAVRTLWDRTDPHPVYVAEEAEPMFDHAAIDAYWERTAAAVDEARMRTWDLRARLVGDDVAAVFFRLRWSIRLRDGRPPIGGDVRVSALLRRTPDGWRFFHYLEGPLAALTQLRRWAESRSEL